ncbi:MAG: DUF2799 domain-containing protein [Gammaproteobacteria bacterium]|nr:DUF2799 domain-containing protein [Gammaproteobacteria bacterium]
MKFKGFGSLIVAVAMLSGCATMSSEECALSDWRAIGFEDGSRGYSSQQFGEHRKACAKHGISADFSAYSQGREQGLREFCQPGRGFNLGERGGSYGGVCSADLEPEFLDAYRAGHQLYTLRSNVNAANSAIYNKERELDSVRAHIRSAEAALIAEETTTEERVLLLVDLKDLSERVGELEAEIDILIAERARHEQELHYYEQTVAAYSY